MKNILLAFCILLATCALGQESADTLNSPGGLRADGKIYVVAAVVLTILLGLFIFLIRLDRKISKLEKNS